MGWTRRNDHARSASQARRDARRPTAMSGLELSLRGGGSMTMKRTASLPAPQAVAAASRESASLDISVVIPCLNEARTIGACVDAAWRGIRAAHLVGEVIVADNGSTDGSRDLAERAGARVVPVARRGYGAALQAGFSEARGRLLVMGDADLSYD